MYRIATDPRSTILGCHTPTDVNFAMAPKSLESLPIPAPTALRKAAEESGGSSSRRSAATKQVDHL